MFPNPSPDGKLSYNVETSAPERTTLQAVDMLGRVLYTSAIGQVNGQYKGMIDLSKHSNGLYMVRLQHGSQVYTHNVMIRK